MVALLQVLTLGGFGRQQVQHEAEKARRMAQRKDYYAILGVGKDVAPRDVKQAYRKGAQQFHPDKAAAAGLGEEEAQARFTDLAEAYEVGGGENVLWPLVL